MKWFANQRIRVKLLSKLFIKCVEVDMYKKIAISLIALSCLCTTAFADTHQDAARELMKVSGTEQIMAQMQLQIESMFLNISSDSEYNAKQQEIVTRYRAEVSKLLAEKMQWQQIEEKVVDLYVASFSEAELKEMVAFYKTPLGQKMIDKMPTVMLRTAEISRQQMRFVIPEVKELGNTMNEELRAAQ